MAFVLSLKELVSSEQMEFFFFNCNSIYYIDHLGKKRHLYAVDFSFKNKSVIP